MPDATTCVNCGGSCPRFFCDTYGDRDGEPENFSAPPSPACVSAARQLLAAVDAELSDAWACNSYHPSLRPAAENLRAVLAATGGSDGVSAEPPKTGELDPQHAIETARTAIGYSAAFDGKDIDWQSDEPWPHRIELAQALDWITELGAMVLNLADRAAPVTPPAPPVGGLTDEQIDAHLDKILRASGSALKHYTMAKSKDDMRAALRAVLAAAGHGEPR